MWKSTYFRNVFANNFYCVQFFKIFSTDLKSEWNSAFFDTHIEFFNKKCFLLVFALSVNFDCKCARNGSKKRKNLFLWMCLRILLGNHQRVCITKLLKSLYPSVYLCWLTFGLLSEKTRHTHSYHPSQTLHPSPASKSLNSKSQILVIWELYCDE